MATTMFQVVVLGLFVASGAFADVKHLRNGKQCHKHKTQKANDNGNLASSFSDQSNVTNSHPRAFSSDEISSGSSSIPAPFGNDTQPTPASSESKSLQQSTPAPLVFNGLSSNLTSISNSIQPTPAPLTFSGRWSVDIASEDSFKLISALYSHFSPSIFGIESQSTSAPFTFSSSSSASPIKYSTSSATPEDSFKSITASYSQSILAPFTIESQSTAVPFTFSGFSSSPAAAVPIESFNTVGSDPIPAPYSYSQRNAFTQYGDHSASSPAQTITINREIPVPYYVQIEKRIPYPVVVHVPHPYQVTVEKHVPYAVRVQVDRTVPVPSPYPVEVEKRVPYPVEKPVPYEVRVPVDRPYPVSVPYEKPVPYAVEKPVPYPVRVNVDRPYPVEKPVPYPVAVERPVPYAVEKPVPHPASAYSKSNHAGSGLIKDSGSYGFDQQSFYGSTTPVPSSTAGYTASSFSPQYKSSDFDSIAQQVGSIAGSVQTGSDYLKSNYTGSGLVQDSGSHSFDQQSFYRFTIHVPSL